MIRMNLFILISIIALAIIISLYAVYINNKTNADRLKSEVSDTVITAEIKSRIMAESDLGVSSVHVETVNGRVILRGIVPSPEAKAKVEEIAKHTTGVSTVQSDLQVNDE